MKIFNLGKYRNDNVTEFDEFLYKELCRLIKTKDENLANFLPEFIMYESMVYFLEKNLFKEYNVVKGHFILNHDKMLKINRNEWLEFGWKMKVKKKKK